MQGLKSILFFFLTRILFLFRYGFNKSNNTGAQMLDSIYRMTLKLF